MRVSSIVVCSGLAFSFLGCGGSKEPASSPTTTTGGEVRGEGSEEEFRESQEEWKRQLEEEQKREKKQLEQQQELEQERLDQDEKRMEQELDDYEQRLREQEQQQQQMPEYDERAPGEDTPGPQPGHEHD